MKDEVRMTIRLPKDIHNRLKAIQEKKPHMSLNALMVEAIYKAEKIQADKAPAMAGKE